MRGGGRVDGDEGIATSVGVLCLVFALIHFSSVFSPPPLIGGISRGKILCVITREKKALSFFAAGFCLALREFGGKKISRQKVTLFLIRIG